jgi:hypothetical protein
MIFMMFGEQYTRRNPSRTQPGQWKVLSISARFSAGGGVAEIRNPKFEIRNPKSEIFG